VTPKQQEAYDLRAAGLTDAQIAARLGIDRTSVRDRLRSIDPAIERAMTAIKTDMIPAMVWDKSDPKYSVMLKPAKADDAANIMEQVANAFKDIPSVLLPDPIFRNNDLMTVYPVMDAHFGMFAWGKETGGQDYDLNLAESDLLQAFSDILAVTPVTQKAVLILGGDTLHADNNDAETPRSKHKLDTDGRHFKAVDVAIRAICTIIDILAARHTELTVRVLRGNHDVSAHMILTFALAERYRLAENVTIDKSPRDLFWVKHGRALVAFHHGDKAPAQRLAMALADECPHWSDTRDRHILTGHIHHDSVKDFPGVKWWSLRAFCPADDYGSSFGPRRALQAMVYCAKKGLILQAIEPIERVK